MAIWIAIFLLMIFNQGYCQSEYGFLNIDCGEDGGYIDDKNITWFTDYGYAKQGYQQTINRSIEKNDPMNTLRVFPYMSKNCYILPAFIRQKYLLRAGFFYGNYNGLSRPPVFDLQFDANSWTTVLTSNDQPVFYEAVIIATRHNVSVCLQRTRQDDVPFISSLQIMQLLPGMYTNMNNEYALFKEYRLNFGSNQTVRYPDDKYGRIWEPAPENNYINVTAKFQSLVSTVNDDPPIAAIRTAIQSKSPSDPILLSFNFQEIVRPSYICLYFTEVFKLSPRQNRTFDIYINGQDFDLKLSPVYQKCNEVHGYVVPTPGMSSFNLSLVPSENSSMPPILSAMELFTVSETLSNGTAPQDVFGLGLITYLSSRLSQWSGDPCLPVPFDWLSCNQENPPRITALYLGNSDISVISNISDMQALEIIDLQNNSLTSVPSFIWDLPNLKSINLAYNDISGTVPESIVERKVSLNITGTNLIVIEPKKNSHKGLIIGLSVAAGVALIGLAAFVFICICSNGERKVSTVEMDNQTATDTVNVSEAQLNNNLNDTTGGAGNRD